MTSRFPESQHEWACCGDIPGSGRDQPYYDQRSDPLRTNRESSQGCLPADADGPEHTPGATGWRDAARIVLRYHCCTTAGFGAPPGMAERRRTGDGSRHQVGQNHGIILVEAAILLLMGTEDVDDDVGQGGEPNGRRE